MNSRMYKTPKGTELPLLNLRGKEYLEVKYRLVWFREDHPDWSIETQLVSVTDVSAYAKATVRDDQGRLIATSHKYESIQGFPDFIEKAETGAIGRALALIGYGTQFCADELDEGKNAEPPAPSKFAKANPFKKVDRPTGFVNLDDDEDEAKDEESFSPDQPGEFVISFGRKYNGKKLKELPKSEVESYLTWLESSAEKQGSPVSKQARTLRQAFNLLYPTETVMPF